MRRTEWKERPGGHEGNGAAFSRGSNIETAQRSKVTRDWEREDEHTGRRELLRRQDLFCMFTFVKTH